MTVALRRAVTVVHAAALFFAGAGTDPRREAFLGGKRRCGRADFEENSENRKRKEKTGMA